MSYMEAGDGKRVRIEGSRETLPLSHEVDFKWLGTSVKDFLGRAGVAT